MKKSVPIGLDNLVYAIMTEDIAPSAPGAGDGLTAYDSSVRVLGAITANFSPNAANDTLFADDGPYDVASAIGAMTLELNVADLQPAHRAELLGATYSGGVLRQSASDIPPFVAVGMSVLKSNGAKRYLWYLKGKFTAPDDNNQTKQESINWNTPTISGNFVKRDSDNEWRLQADTDDDTAVQNTLDTWFESPNVGTLQKVEPPVASPGAGALSKGTTAKVAVTSATVGATIEFKLSTSSAWTTYSDGTDIATTAWPEGIVVVNLRASKAGMASATKSVTYLVEA